MTNVIAVGTEVQDQDGFVGTVVAVTEYEGRFWYDVKFNRGVAVRYPEELEVVG